VKKERTFRTEQRTERYSELDHDEEYTYQPWPRAEDPTNECFNLGIPFPGWERSGLLRKEVIQPHLPVRLPCYDFTLIADSTFDSSVPCGFGHWLRAFPTFMV
jgi:hypothetical protein